MEFETKMASLIDYYRGETRPGAAVAVSHLGKVVFEQYYGMANIEEKLPVTRQTNFRLASLTKQFTAYAILILAEQNKISLDQRLTDYLPEFPEYGREMTVRHLLNHTSGVPDYETLIHEGRTRQLDDEDVLQLLSRQTNALFPPGTAYQYSNSGYVLLGRIIEQVDGRRLADFLNQAIFEPLGMSGTWIAGGRREENRAFGYSRGESKFKRTDQSLTSAVLGDGGVYSSLADLFLWDKALLSDKLLPGKWLKEAFTPGELANGQRTGYGFGWQIIQYRGLRALTHSGSSVGFRNFIARFPGQKTTIVVLTNRSEAIPEAILDLVLEQTLPVCKRFQADPALRAMITGSKTLDPFSG
jgi:CubicO group peptidase (beta-lactamase class C family)